MGAVADDPSDGIAAREEWFASSLAHAMPDNGPPDTETMAQYTDPATAYHARTNALA